MEVDFHGWTHGGRRQASFQGVREDKTAKDVVRETRKALPPSTGRSREASASGDRPKLKSRGGVVLTHPDRLSIGRHVASPNTNSRNFMSNLEVDAAALVGRPIALLRCPEGASGECFFQKHATMVSRPNISILFRKKATRLFPSTISTGDRVGPGGVLEIHTRGTTIEDRERADRLVFDLDPGPGTTGRTSSRPHAKFVTVLRHQAQMFSQDLGRQRFACGAAHQADALGGSQGFRQSFAEAMDADDPDRHLSTATKAKRDKRIFVDYLRNSREATAVAPYSTRAREGAPVSVPIDWSELGSLKAANQYTVQNLMQRLSRRRKDPWAIIGRIKQSLPKLK